MTVHDMAMTSFQEWWGRCIRTGYGFAQVGAPSCAAPERHVLRYVYSTLLWGVGVPLLIIALAWPTRPIEPLSCLGLSLARRSNCPATPRSGHVSF